MITAKTWVVNVCKDLWVLYPQRMEDVSFVRQALEERLDALYQPPSSWGPAQDAWNAEAGSFIAAICGDYADAEGLARIAAALRAASLK